MGTACIYISMAVATAQYEAQLPQPCSVSKKLMAIHMSATEQGTSMA